MKKVKNINGGSGILTQAVLRKAKEISLLFRGARLSASEAAAAAEGVRALLDGEEKDTFVSAAVENGRPLWFWASKVAPDDFHGRLITLKHFISAKEAVSSGAIARLCAEARKFHRAGRLKVQLGLAPSEAALAAPLCAGGFRVSMHLLAGRIEDSLRYLRGLPGLPPGLTLRALDITREHGAYLDLQVRALQSDSTSTMYRVPAARIRKIFLKYEKKDSPRISYGVFDGKKLAGSVTVSVEKFPRKAGLLATITLLPRYRGLGLSKHLYRAGLLWLKARGVTHYVGNTSTAGVLAMAKKMKRRSAVTYLIKA